ncbi:MAG: hypothetical protein ACRCZO_17890 [Cetobacterium sp.]
MQLETLLIVKNYILENKKLSNLLSAKICKFIDFLKSKEINDYIMPMEVVYLLEIEILDGFLLMSHLKYLSIVEENYQIKCSNCKKESYVYYVDLDEAENSYCEFCNSDYDLDKKNIILLYKVITK